MFPKLTPAEIAQNKADYEYKGGTFAARNAVEALLQTGTLFTIKGGKTYRSWGRTYVGHDGFEYVTCRQWREERHAEYGPGRHIKVANILAIV